MPKNRGRKKAHAAPRYVSNAEELANRSGAFAKADQDRRAHRKAAGCDDDDGGSGSDGGGGFLGQAARGMRSMDLDGDGGGGGAAAPKREKKPKGMAAILGVETANPNKQKKKANTLSRKDAADGNFEKATLSRREREVLQADEDRRRHLKLTAEGKTEQSKKDLARLKEMKAKRAAKKKAREEAAAKAAAEEAAAAAASAAAQDDAPSDSDDDEKPTKIEIKKMKPPQLKEWLKKLKQSTQGNKKALQARLIAACGY